MPISTIREAKGLTAQTLADMALQEDQARRRALRRGDLTEAAHCDRETARLCALSREAR